LYGEQASNCHRREGRLKENMVFIFSIPGRKMKVRDFIQKQFDQRWSFLMTPRES
jgi:hypothetical protein